MTDLIDTLLNTDPLLEAERLTGKSYKEDRETEALGFLLHMASGEAKRKALQATDDTHYSCDYALTLRVLSELGFAEIHSHNFTGYGEEVFKVFWNPVGAIVTAESYSSEAWNKRTTNNLKMYYNWRSGTDPYKRLSSGRFVDDQTISGDTDVREGLRHHFNGFMADGEFLPQWVDTPWLWFVDYSQTKEPGYDHKAINAEVIATFPDHVRKAIGVDSTTA